MRWKNSWLYLMVVLISILSARPSSAGNGFDAQAFHWAVDDGPYFSLYGSDALEQWQWTVGTSVNYGYHPFQWIMDGERYRGIIDHEITQDIYGSVGLVGRWLQVGVDMPINWWINFINPRVDPLTVSPSDQNVTRLGDVKLVLKSELLELEKHRVGVALLPFITFPTGSTNYFAGAGNVTGGGKLIVDFLPLKRWMLDLNVGALFRNKYTIHNLTEGNNFQYGLGTAVEATKNLSVAAEVLGRTPFETFWTERDSTPLELDAGVKYMFGDTGLKLSGGAGYGIIRGAGDARVRGFVNIAYHAPFKPVEKPPPAIQPKFMRLKEQIHFKTAKWNILPESYPTLDEVVTALETHPEIKKIQIEGHTDSRGSDSYNQKLSEKRAKSVYDYMIKHGIDSNRLTWIGYGESRPIDTNDTDLGRTKNRRTTIRLLEVDSSILPPKGDETLRYETGDPDLEKEGTLYPDK